MTEKINKLLIIPIDGSKDALRSLDYISLSFGTAHHLKVILLYVLPTLPPMLTDQGKKDRATALKLKEFEEKNVQMAQRILSQAKDRLLNKGFESEKIEAVYRKKEVDTARDICSWAGKRQADAILLNTRGRSRIEAFFMGETARKVLESAKVCPVWLVKGSVKSRRVLVAVDSSVNAVRAADHAGFMLSGTDRQVTLFHSKRDLRRYVPKELLEDAAELQALWEQSADQDITRYMKEAREKLIEAGLDKSRIKTRVVKGSRSPAADILKEARKGEFGTIVMGRKGRSSLKEFIFGSVTCKVVENFDDAALWIVR